MLLVLVLKIVFFCVLAIVVRGTIPRYRIDQLLSLNWKISVYYYLSLLIVFILLTFLFNVAAADVFINKTKPNILRDGSAGVTQILDISSVGWLLDFCVFNFTPFCVNLFSFIVNFICYLVNFAVILVVGFFVNDS